MLTGVAGMAAGAFAMAAGEYVSVQSQRELYEYQIGLERDELKEYPEAEAQELALIYAAKGLPPKQADRLAKRLVADPEHALDTLAREELGPQSRRARIAAGRGVEFARLVRRRRVRAARPLPVRRRRPCAAVDDRRHRHRAVRRRRRAVAVHRAQRAATPARACCCWARSRVRVTFAIGRTLGVAAG